MLKFELKKVENNVISYKILEQSNDIGKFLPFDYKVIGKTIAKIDSQSMPELSNNTSHLAIYLRGCDHEYDNTVCMLTLENFVERDKVYDFILLVFNELSKKWKIND